MSRVSTILKVVLLFSAFVAIPARADDDGVTKIATEYARGGRGVTAQIKDMRIRARRLVQAECQYGYGACQGWNSTEGEWCFPGARPCYEEGYTWCRYFPECPQ